MFGILRRKKAEVLKHWYALIENFQTSAQDFYTHIEAELQARKVPAMETSRVEFSEGGPLSDKRVYLRMIRERFVFDICAAPFGTSYFFSFRFAVIPPIIRLWEVIAFLSGLFLTFLIAVRIAGFFRGSFLLFAALLICIFVLRHAIALGLRDLDMTLIKIPVLGPLYERFLRKETYYRTDTRPMYHDTVSEIVERKVEEIAAANGVKLLRVNESSLLGETYKKKEVALAAKKLVDEMKLPA